MRETAAKNIPGTKMYRGYFSSCAYSEESASASIAASAAEDQKQEVPRMIHRQLSLPHPHPSPILLLPHPPQKISSKMIHRQELLPLLKRPPFSHPHPQFVALKSLILDILQINCLQFHNMWMQEMCASFFKKSISGSFTENPMPSLYRITSQLL